MSVLLLLLSFQLFAQAPKLNQEKELEVVDFKNVKDVLKKDGLLEEAKKKQTEVKKIQELRVKTNRELYNWPREDEFWFFATEYWMVKEVSVLKWDIEKPDYGLDKSLTQLLKQVGLAQKKFRIMGLNANTPAHLGLAWMSEEYCLLFSIPFVRSMDLSKLEISLLLLQDMLRVDEGWLKESIRPENLKSLVETNFEGKKPDLSPVFQVAKNYRSFLDEKGFSFQQQFEITKKMNSLLKTQPELWNAYVRLLGKMDRLIKSQGAFADYVKMYPSPEMQIRWLAPEEKAL
jgi:hypothetical protein